MKTLVVVSLLAIIGLAVLAPSAAAYPSPSGKAYCVGEPGGSGTDTSGATCVAALYGTCIAGVFVYDHWTCVYEQE